MTAPRHAGARFDAYEMMADLQRRDPAAAATLADEYPNWPSWTLHDVAHVVDHVAVHPQLRATTAAPVLRAHLTRASR